MKPIIKEIKSLSDIPKEEPVKKGYVKSTDLFVKTQGQEAYYFDYQQAYKPWTFQYWSAKIKLKNQKKKIFLVLMHLRNGKYDILLISTNNPYFEYRGGLYQIDADMSREDTHTKLSTLYYHQDIALPFKIDFDLDELHTKLQKEGNSLVDKALNPYSLKAFINSQVIEKVLKGQELSEEMRLIKIILIINLLLTIVSLILMARSQGWI